jgi:hypothetical protein
MIMNITMKADVFIREAALGVNSRLSLCPYS